MNVSGVLTQKKKIKKNLLEKKKKDGHLKKGKKQTPFKILI